MADVNWWEDSTDVGSVGLDAMAAPASASETTFAGPDYGAGAQPAEAVQDQAAFGNSAAAPGTGAGAKPGWTDGLSAWVKSNKEVAAALAQGILGALGGAGAASINQSTMQKKADLELRNANELAQAKITRTAGGTLNSPLAMRPAATSPLLITSGVPVYDPATGHINRAMR